METVQTLDQITYHSKFHVLRTQIYYIIVKLRAYRRVKMGGKTRIRVQENVSGHFNKEHYVEISLA